MRETPHTPEEQDHVVKTASSRSTARAPDTLFLDFNPRDLVNIWTPSQPSLNLRGHGGVDLQAIYVPSKCRAERVSRLLEGFSVTSAPIYLLPTLPSDMPFTSRAQGPRLDHLVIEDLEFLGALHALRCVSNPVFAVPEADWDLPLKRNYALWHAQEPLPADSSAR